MKLQLLLALLIFNLSAYSQWQNLGNGISGPGYDMLYEPSTNKLYVGGFFDYADGLRVNALTVWDGLVWDSLGSGALGNYANALCKYQGEIYAAALFEYDTVNGFNCLAKWDGINWVPLNERVSDAIFVFKEHNNELYFGGAFDKIGQTDARLLAKFNGSTFTTLSIPSDAGGYMVRAIEFFQGQMYIGGNFYDTLAGVHDLMRWNGTSFETFGGHGLGVGGSYVSSMVIYNNDLFIAGGFDTHSGAIANHIMRWDGNQFYDLDGGVNGMIRRMHVFNGKLYVSGDFTMAGNVPIVNHLAVWDGIQWKAVFHNTLNNIISDFIIINNDLYITGGFTLIDTIPINHIGKYENLIAIDEIHEEVNTSIYPNPSNASIKVICNQDIQSLKLYSSSGQLLLSKRINARETTIDVSTYAHGLYFISIETRKGIIMKKAGKY